MTPDLDASPEVFIWMCMFRGDVGAGESSERPLWSWVAFFEESTLDTMWRLETAEVRGLHLSVSEENG